jgi:FkbM family methyltransferase
MMLNFTDLIRKHNIKPRGIIQLGAHHFQEAEEFVKLGIKDFVLVEPQKEAFEIMQAKCHNLNVLAFNCAVSDFEGEADMFCDTANEGQSSSLLQPKQHIQEYPTIAFNRTEKVKVHRLENLEFDREKYNILVMDIQGNELKALQGSGILLNTIDAIYTEVNFAELYENCVQIAELDEYLANSGFKRVETGQITNNWTDAFYIKT